VKEKKGHPALLIASLLFVAAVAALMLMPHGLKRRSQGGFGGFLLPAPNNAEAAEVSSWAQAVRKVKEDRGAPVGKQAKVDTPPQLRHYSDKRRFLAVQVAEWREHRFATPRDFVDLAAMLGSGEMVELQPVTHDYILFGVGGSADLEPFTRYKTGESITLYNEAELAQEYTRMAESRATLENEIADLRQELTSLNKRERSARARLQNQISEKEKTLKAVRDSKELLDRSYGDADKRQQLFRDYESLESLAKSFSGNTYDIADARSRREMKVHMLSSLRPEAFKVLEEIAASYRQKFDRPLPVSSLVRPDEYQHALGKVNPNATRIETPPHSTGLAFDIYNRYMTAEEQSYVMDYLARLKDEGRIEVLRENRDHYHVFAFVDGVRPDEAFIRASLSTVSSSGATKETQASE
jgi:cell division protein FtsB